MQTLRDITPYIALATAGLIVALAVLVLVQWRAVRRLRGSQLVVLGVHGERDLVDHAHHLDEQVRNLRDAVEALDVTVAAHKRELDHAFTYRAVVRYDAFRDIGGEQSASIALLDEHRSGVVISSIHSRDYARLYVKLLREGVPDRALSPEEVEAVELAMQTPLEVGAAATATPRKQPTGRGPQLWERAAAGEAPPSTTETAPEPLPPEE